MYCTWEGPCLGRLHCRLKKKKKSQLGTGPQLGIRSWPLSTTDTLIVLGPRLGKQPCQGPEPPHPLEDILCTEFGTLDFTRLGLSGEKRDGDKEGGKRCAPALDHQPMGRRIQTLSQASRFVTQQCGLIETVHLHAIYHTCCRYRATAPPPGLMRSLTLGYLPDLVDPEDWCPPSTAKTGADIVFHYSPSPPDLKAFSSLGFFGLVWDTGFHHRYRADQAGGQAKADEAAHYDNTTQQQHPTATQKTTTGRDQWRGWGLAEGCG